MHFQWVGSDFNTDRNPNNAEGWRYSDRHNMVQVNNLNQQVPMYVDDHSFFEDPETIEAFAMQVCGCLRRSRSADPLRPRRPSPT